MKVIFTRDKETKRTIRYTAPIGAVITGSLYVNKESSLSFKPTLEVEVSESPDMKVFNPTE